MQPMLISIKLCRYSTLAYKICKLFMCACQFCSGLNQISRIVVAKSSKTKFKLIRKFESRWKSFANYFRWDRLKHMRSIYLVTHLQFKTENNVLYSYISMPTYGYIGSRQQISYLLSKYAELYFFAIRCFQFAQFKRFKL